MNVVMRMPALGAVDDMVKVLRWLVEVGQMIERGQPLLEVETDKSIMEWSRLCQGYFSRFTFRQVVRPRRAKRSLRSPSRATCRSQRRPDKRASLRIILT